MGKTKGKGKKKGSRKYKKKTIYPSIKRGVTYEFNSINTTKLLTVALADPYSNPQYNTMTLVPRITDCPGQAQMFLQDYAWFRIAGVEMTIHNKDMPKVHSVGINPGAAGSSAYQYLMNTEFIIIPNRDGTNYTQAVSSTDWDHAKQNAKAIWVKKIKGMQSKTVRCKPSTLTMTYEGIANTGYVTKYDQWFRNNDSGTPFYTWTVFIKTQSVLREQYEITFKYIIQYKDKNGKDYNSTLEFGQRLTHPVGGAIDAHTAGNTNDTGLHVEKTDDALCLIYPDHDPDEVPTSNGYDDLDISQLP